MHGHVNVIFLNITFTYIAFLTVSVAGKLFTNSKGITQL